MTELHAFVFLAWILNVGQVLAEILDQIDIKAIQILPFVFACLFFCSAVS